MTTHGRDRSPLVVVSSYTRFDNLAHGPRGTEAKRGVSVMRLDGTAGTLELLTVTDGVMNPAFMRCHPHLNVLYGCTESVKDYGGINLGSITRMYDKPSDFSATLLNMADEIRKMSIGFLEIFVRIRFIFLIRGLL